MDRLLAMPAYATSGDVALKPGFDRIRALLAGMGHPEQGREIILVAGTNGKGSTASMLAAMSTAAGVRTGLHTSPHLRWVGERMRVDGETPTEAWLSEAFETWEPLFKDVEPSFFETTLALSFIWFAARDAERWVVEIGLGGRLDAANVLDADLGILTSVGRDHLHLLGPTLSDVAREKAAIARLERPFILGPLQGEVRSAALETLTGIGAEVLEPLAPDDGPSPFTLSSTKRTVTGIELPMDSPHQRINALLALEALDVLHHPPVPSETVRDGFARLSSLSGLRARQEWVHPDVMVDVCHNEDALRASLLVFLREVEGRRGSRDLPREAAKRVRIVLGFLADKDLGQIGGWLQKTVDGGRLDGVELVAVSTPGARGQVAAETAEALRNSGWNRGVESSDSLDQVLDARSEDGGVMFVGGSYLIASRALERLDSP